MLKTERIIPNIIFIYIFKYFYHNLVLSKQKNKKLLFVVGCQRSGTSLMNRIFTRDLNASVYRESSWLSSKDKGKRSLDDMAKQLRLNSFEDLQKSFEKNKASLIVLKPLVESQNILDLLNCFPESKALWMYRHYKDVAYSMLQRFSPNSSIRDLRYIIKNDQNNWRSEAASDEVRSIISQYFSEDMNVYDACALFWFARNRLFYELNLGKDSRILLCKYENLVTQPSEEIMKIYKFINNNCTLNHKSLKEINNKSVGKGDSVNLSPSVEKLCDELLRQLNSTYSSQEFIQMTNLM